jgi:hypothetical protein
VNRQATDASDRARDEQLAKLYEYLVLRDLSIPAGVEEAMRAAYRRVQLRGLDPLRRSHE